MAAATRGRGEIVQRVGEGQRRAPSSSTPPAGARLAQEAGGKPVGHRVVGGVAPRVGHLAEQRGIGLGEAAFGDQAELQQRTVEPLASLLRDKLGTLQRTGITVAGSDRILASVATVA